MTRTLLPLAAAVLFALISPALAQQPDQPKQEQPKAPSADTAKEALASSPRHGEWADVPLKGSDQKLHTWVVYPERKDKAPVVLVIHEIFGMTDWVRAVADQLAANGFIAVAPDLLSGKGPGGGGTDSFEQGQARGAIQKLTPDEVTARLDAAREWALAQPSAGKKTGVIGFCWGGGMSFLYATRQPQLNAAIVDYGTPPRGDAMEKINCPVLGCYGGDDARVTATVAPTKQVMNDLHKEYTPRIFDGAGHGFLRQQSGRAGNQNAADQAWKETTAFFKQNLE
jgi:carboxymethylenebutenolidase